MPNYCTLNLSICAELSLKKHLDGHVAVFLFFVFPSSVHVFSQYCFSQQILFANMQNLHDGLRSGYKHVLLPTSICKVHGATHWMHLLLLPSLHLTVSHQYCYSGSSERLPGFFRATQ